MIRRVLADCMRSFWEIGDSGKTNFELVVMPSLFKRFVYVMMSFASRYRSCKIIYISFPDLGFLQI